MLRGRRRREEILYEYLDLGEEVREDGRGVELKRKHASGYQKERDEHGDKAPAHDRNYIAYTHFSAWRGGITGSSDQP